MSLSVKEIAMGNMQKLSIGLLGATALSFLSASSAYALGTTAGTNVDNTFTLDYKVGTVQQTQITPPAPTTFMVDRFVDLTVTSEGDENVAPGSTAQVLEYTLTNLGNGTQSYVLTTLQGVDATDDDFDAITPTITYFIDSNGDGTLNGSETLETYSGNTDPLAPDETMIIYVTSDIGIGEEDGDESDITLVADTTDSGTATPTADDSSGDATNQLTGEDVILGDDDNTEISGDDSNSGDDAATGTYIVAAADIAANKEVIMISQDGSGCTAFPVTEDTTAYSVPGACVEYTITLENSGSTAAVDVDLTDNLADELVYQFAQLSGFTGSPAFTIDGAAVTATPIVCDTSAGAPAGAQDCEILVDGATIAAGATATLKILAIVQ